MARPLGVFVIILHNLSIIHISEPRRKNAKYPRGALPTGTPRKSPGFANLSSGKTRFVTVAIGARTRARRPSLHAYFPDGPLTPSLFSDTGDAEAKGAVLARRVDAAPGRGAALTCVVVPAAAATRAEGPACRTRWVRHRAR